MAIASASRGLAAAEESYRVRRALFQNGRATSVELTDAETERSRAQLEAIAHPHRPAHRQRPPAPRPGAGRGRRN